MVKLKLLLTVLLVSWTLNLAVAVDISVQLISPVENVPIQGIITITHDPSEKIDLRSFRMINQPFKVEFVQEKKGPPFSSTYHFQVDPMAKGLYLFPQISVQACRSTPLRLSPFRSPASLPHAPPTREPLP